MAGSPRELKITYGTYTVGGDNETALLDGGYQKVGGETVDVYSFAAIIVASSEADMASKVAAFETAFSTPRALFKIELGSQTIDSRLPASNTGFNAQASFQKASHVVDTNRSRHYTVTVATDKPTTLGQSGRRNARTRVFYENSDRIHVFFSGEYTALGSNAAKAQFDASFDTYAEAFLAGLGGTFERLTKDLDIDDAGKVLKYQVEYQEIISSQGGPTDISAVVDHNVLISSSLEAPGEFGAETVHLTDVVATYACDVKKTDVDLETLWSNTLFPYLVEKAKATFSPRMTAIVGVAPAFDFAKNKIAAVVRMRMAIGKATILSAAVFTTISDAGGHTITDVHDGQDFSGYVDPGPSVRITTQEEVYEVLGVASPEKTFGKGSGVFLDGFSRAGTRKMGTKDGQQIDISTWSKTIRSRYVVPPKGGGGGNSIGDPTPGGGIIGGIRPGPGGAVDGILR